MKVIAKNYSHLTFAVTKTDFRAHLNQNTGNFVGVADVTDQDTLDTLAKYDAFEILTDEEFAALVDRPAADAPSTGDPLDDAKAASEGDAAVVEDRLEGADPLAEAAKSKK